MTDDQIKTIISCPECATRLSITTSQTDPKAFTCSNPSCKVLFTVLPDMSVLKGDHRRSYRQKVEVMSRIRSIQDQLSGIPETDAKEERELLDDLKEMIKAMKERPSEDTSRFESMLKDRDERIGAQEAEIVKLRGEISSLQKVLDEAHAKRAEQDRQLSEVSLTSSDPNLEIKFRALQQKFKEQAATLKDWQARLEKNERDLSTALAAKEKAEVRIASIADKEKAIQERSILLDDREMELDAREKEVQSKEKDLSTREEGARLCEDDLNRSRAEIAALQEMLGPLRSQLEREKEVMKREREDLLALKASIPMEEDLSANRGAPALEGARASEIDNERFRLSEWEKDLKAREDRLRTTPNVSGPTAQDDARISKLKEALLKKNDEISDLKANLVEAQKKAAGSSGPEARLKEMLEEKVEENAKLKLALSDAEGRYLTASKQADRVGTLEKENATLHSSIEALRSDMERNVAAAREDQGPSWRTEMEVRESMLSQKMAEVEKRERELSDYSGQLTSYHAELTKRFEEFGSEYSRFQEEKAAAGSAGYLLQQTASQDLARLEKAETEVAALRSELENAQKEIEKRNAAIIKMQERITKGASAAPGPAVDNQVIGEKDAVIDRLGSRIKELESLIAQHDSDRSTMKERMERSLLEKDSWYGSIISERDSAIEALRAQVDQMTSASRTTPGPSVIATSTEAASDRSSELEAEIASLKDQVLSLERSVKDHTEAGSRQEAALTLLREKFAQAMKANKELSEEKVRLNTMIEGLQDVHANATEASSKMAEKDRRIEELEISLASAKEAASATSSYMERIASLTEELASVKVEAAGSLRSAVEGIEKERKALAEERDRLRKEAESGKERLRQRLMEVSLAEKRNRHKAEEGPGAETVFECPYCKSSIPEKGIDSGSCPSCNRKFKVAEELVIEIYECPSCGRTLTKSALSKGTCAFCGVRFRS